MRGDRGDQGEATFYVVRVWSMDQGFRAEVRDVRCERDLAFCDAVALADFLAAAPCRAAADAPLEAVRDRKEES